MIWPHGGLVAASHLMRQQLKRLASCCDRQLVAMHHFKGTRSVMTAVFPSWLSLQGLRDRPVLLGVAPACEWCILQVVVYRSWWLQVHAL